MTHNNVVKKDKTGKQTMPEERLQFLALVARIFEPLKGRKQGGVDVGGVPHDEDKMKSTQNGARKLLLLRFENPKSKKTRVFKGTTVTWCAKKFHTKPMWCGRPNCLDWAEYAAKIKKEWENTSGGSSGGG